MNMNETQIHINNIPIWALLPFILMLGSIAVMPIAANWYWEKNLNKLFIALVLGIPTALWLILTGLSQELTHTMIFDYIPFIILLGSLFVITGGIYVDGDIEAKPSNNSVIIGIGAVLASFMGTTGAAMLLIRPLMKTIHLRKYKVHSILFFIAIVANCGGLLTPLGDPPLFMMYLRGADFFWFFNLFPEWFLTNGLLLIIYYFVDSYYWKKEDPAVKIREKTEQKPIKLLGKVNFIFLIGVVLSVAFLNPGFISWIVPFTFTSYTREVVIITMAVLSLILTKKQVRYYNRFNWGPIEEVAYLFLGIFITMVPCLIYLENNASTLGIISPVQFYYSSGSLSSFLDNTPTAVTFHSLAKGLVILGEKGLVAGINESILYAISLGSVFFGAMTYIGNGPNFMVKAIAEHNHIKMPHFFEYMYKFSLIVLLPIYILIQLIFM
ncbi:MAG: Arsenite permease-like protein [Ignavibacteria bacterium]|nr:Arsenite permease-like protein [Ignavibacteria bacterium]